VDAMEFPPLEWDVLCETDTGYTFINSYRTREEAEWGVELLLNTPRSRDAPAGSSFSKTPPDAVVVKAEIRYHARPN